MADIYVKSGGGTIGSGSYRGNWTASSTYALGDRVCGVATSDYWIFECTTAGTSGATEPTWVKTAGSTTTDNTVTWTARIPSTWENATLTLAKAAANDAAGDNIYVAHDHSETTASAMVLAFAGTLANPVKVICTNSSTGAISTGAFVATSGTNTLSLTGGCYVYGIWFKSGSGTGSVDLRLNNAGNSPQTFESCTFETGSTGNNTNRIVFNQNNTFGNIYATVINCGFKFNHTSQGINCWFGIFTGCYIVSGSANVTYLFNSAYTALAYFKCIGFDLSNLSPTVGILSNASSTHGLVQLLNCKMPSGWSGSVNSSTIARTFTAALYNCDSGATNYRLWIETYAGSIKSETTLVKTGGATDGTTPISWKLASTANANEYVAPLITDDMAIWIDTTGASKTITVDILHDSVTALTDAEVWLEIDYLGSSAAPLGTPAADKRATVLTTPTNQATSTATWTTTGMTNPNKQKLEVAFTPNMKGFVYARVNLAKASYTIYVDPEPVLA